MYLIIKLMKSSAVLKEMRSLRESWNKQSFKFTNEQRKRYDELLILRRARVKEMLSAAKDK